MDGNEEAYKVQLARELEMLEAAFSSWREGEGGCRQSDPGSPYLSYPFINFHNKCRGTL